MWGEESKGRWTEGGREERRIRSPRVIKGERRTDEEREEEGRRQR